MLLNHIAYIFHLFIVLLQATLCKLKTRLKVFERAIMMVELLLYRIRHLINHVSDLLVLVDCVVVVATNEGL